MFPENRHGWRLLLEDVSMSLTCSTVIVIVVVFGVGLYYYWRTRKP